MRKRPVLIVEDEPDIVDSLTTIFSMEGFPILTAKNGREALDVMLKSESAPGMILLDLMMPVMDGHQFLKELQCHSAES
jgi:DNA-binding response OmpR family regulator